tara:strand:- start:38696 stop:39223 length:528 start_codon:yes stop_codon:yes gene_type:complete
MAKHKKHTLTLLIVLAFLGALITGIINYMYRPQIMPHDELPTLYLKATLYQDQLITTSLRFRPKDMDSAVAPVKVWSKTKDGKVYVSVFKQLVMPFKMPQFYTPTRQETEPKVVPSEGEYEAKILVGNPHSSKYYYLDGDKAHPLRVELTHDSKIKYKDLIRKKMQERIEQVKSE